MQRYGWGSAQEGLQFNPASEWTGAGAHTGLEEPMRHLGLGSGSGGGESYPQRPDEADCIYYLRTGFCGYGPRCRFHHPRDRSAVVGALRPGRGEYPERVGQPLCQYYMKTGMCKFGASCKYHHPRQGGGSHVSVNYWGYPLRPGEKECTYYMKTGHCKFGGICKFHHPQPDGIQVPAASPAPRAAPVPAPGLYSTVQSPSALSSQQYGVVAGNWQVARPPPLLPGSYIQGYSHVLLSPGMIPIAGWSPYHAPVNPVASPSTQPTIGSGQFYGITQLSPSAPAYTGAYPLIPSTVGPFSSSQKEHAYPERPGQPECHFYMKTGECKYESSCKYHHPELITPKTSVVLSLMDLPLRPGAPSCSYYAQHGVCNFGPTCKFDHPMGGTLSYSPSASSFGDMPIAPYPVGSSLGTLAPSSSSTELRPELTSGSSKDSPSTRMSSSMSTSSSVGSLVSKGGHVQQSGQSSVPTGSSSSEARTST